jgi:hypothetical protein
MAIAVAAFALVLNGCIGFTIRGFHFRGQKALEPGEATTLKIDMYRQAISTDTTAYVGLLIFVEDVDLVEVSDLDIKGNFGGPYTPVVDPALLAELDDSECYPDGSPGDSVLIRTPVEVDSSMGGFSQKFRTKLRLERPDGTDDDGVGGVFVFSVIWDDDGDAVPEAADDDILCTSGVMALVPYVPAGGGG